MSTVIISLILIVIVAVIVRGMYRDKQAGKNSCGCGCQGCASAGICHQMKGPQAADTKKHQMS
ncbi:MAG: FeoB-associated Cys-rich membrane protein [Lachnospiraceae bacterium]|nr:FeoB-associated Cys-rich membrane protein [Lachnospiraceae bacterium]